MKPQNEFEKNVVSASANLPSLTDRQLQWGLDNSIQYVARYNKQKYTCTKCGHQLKSASGIIILLKMPTFGVIILIC